MWCWHKYGEAEPIERGGIQRGMLMLKMRKQCSRCDKVKTWWTGAVYVP